MGIFQKSFFNTKLDSKVNFGYKTAPRTTPRRALRGDSETRKKTEFKKRPSPAVLPPPSMSVTVEQVREHLEQLGYFDVPDEVLQDFRRELSTRIVGTAHSALEEEEQESAGVEIHPARGYGVEEGDEGAKRGLGGTPVRVRAASRLGGKAMRVDPRVAIKLDQYEADESENEKENMQNKAERPATSDRPRSATARRPITAPGYAPPPARQERQETHAPSRMSANTSLSTSRWGPCALAVPARPRPPMR